MAIEHSKNINELYRLYNAVQQFINKVPNSAFDNGFICVTTLARCMNNDGSESFVDLYLHNSGKWYKQRQGRLDTEHFRLNKEGKWIKTKIDKPELPLTLLEGGLCSEYVEATSQDINDGDLICKILDQLDFYYWLYCIKEPERSFGPFTECTIASNIALFVCFLPLFILLYQILKHLV